MLKTKDTNNLQIFRIKEFIRSSFKEFQNEFKEHINVI